LRPIECWHTKCFRKSLGVPIMRRLIVSVLVIAFITSAAFGSSTPDQKHIEKIRKKVASCVENSRHVSIETYDRRELQGSISEANSDTFVLSFHNNSTTLNYADVKTIKWPSALSKAAKTVIAVTAVTGGLFLAVVLLGGLRGQRRSTPSSSTFNFRLPTIDANLLAEPTHSF